MYIYIYRERERERAGGRRGVDNGKNDVTEGSIPSTGFST